ncbi:Cyclic nucleotide-gated ion channel 17 [Vitis vinifera]|uniref:Cyclic nucleotide-gated ion channel 17 n=1 Tax=Vitis vinifera TaxID=29760 RepID=A0A438CQE4_VITVI|nr:Cyclic nucleotide-gated ion channel 17 [Vitis vinifera]RVW68272.1 Cyclic nucleotide-gated ion channel 17 [Vitis vinifera]
MFEELVMWSDAPKSIIHGVDLKRQDRAYNSLLVCAKETLEVPDVKSDFSSARRCSICSVVKGLVSTSLAGLSSNDSPPYLIKLDIKASQELEIETACCTLYKRRASCLLKASELPGEIVGVLAKSSCNLLEINEIQVGESPVNIVCALWLKERLTYLQSITVRLEEWRLKRRDTEEWMRHRQLPEDLRQLVRRFVQYKWVATRGVDEEAILRGLPADLRRDIQRHLCLDLVRRAAVNKFSWNHMSGFSVPFFSQMDDQLLDAICERLTSSLSTEGTYIVREGDPVTEMLFIIRGRLESSTTNGGRTGFFNSITLRPGDFCGEELLEWALLRKSTLNLPSSTRTVRTLVEVEAFALRAEDLKFVANQFRRLHSKKLQHTFRFYSHHWRTWAACFIQAAWRRYKRRLMARDLTVMEFFSWDEKVVTETEQEKEDHASSNLSQPKVNLGVTMLASRFAANTRRGAQKVKGVGMSKLQKPEEPDFTEPDDD